MIEITGHTYIHRHFLRAQGCTWSAPRKAWMAPDAATAARCQAVVNADQPARARMPARDTAKATVHARVDASPYVTTRARQHVALDVAFPDHACALALARAVQTSQEAAEMIHHARDLAAYVLHNPDLQAVRTARVHAPTRVTPSGAITVPLPWEGGPDADDPRWDVEAERAAELAALEEAGSYEDEDNANRRCTPGGAA